MTTEEAKNFFKQYGGFHFHMGREEPDRYRQYRMLEITDETEDEWRSNLVDASLDSMEVPGRQWLWFFNLNRQLRAFHRKRPEYCRVMLERARQLTGAEPMQRLALLKVLAGDDRNCAAGAIRTLYDCGTDREELRQLVEEMGNFEPYPATDVPASEREEAMARCRRALAGLK